MASKMISTQMIKAGKDAYWGHFKGYSTDSFTKQIEAIYEAMVDQKQKDATKLFASRSE